MTTFYSLFASFAIGDNPNNDYASAGDFSAKSS